MKHEWTTFENQTGRSTVSKTINALIKQCEAEGYEPIFTNTVCYRSNDSGSIVVLVYVTGKRTIEVGYREPG